MKIKNFLIRMAQGAVIGVAMIIPGVSGGTLAVLMNVYDKLITAISNLRRDFINSAGFLIPVLLGAALALVAAYFPIKTALEYAPFPTVMLFTGLMLGSCPKLVRDGIKQGFKPFNIACIAIPFIAVIAICFIPNLGNADLSSAMPLYGYPLLIVMGALASCALVIPGVSGSMLLLIFGYYNPIFETISSLFTEFGHSVLVLGTFALGILIGFFSIAKLMKLLLTKLPRGTTWAIIGFVLGSVPALLITFNGNFPNHVYSSMDINTLAVGIFVCALGVIGSFAVTAYAEEQNKLKAKKA